MSARIDLPAVLSVNGETGVVVLDADDVGAADDAEVAAEEADRIAADQALDSRTDSLEALATALDADIDAEIAARIAAINAEAAARVAAINAEAAARGVAINAEAATRAAADAAQVAATVAEVARATAAEGVVATAVVAETARATGAETAVAGTVAAEAATRAAQDALLIPLAQKNAAGGVAPLDGGNTVPDANLPAGLARDAEVTLAIAAEATARDAAIDAKIAAFVAGAPPNLDEWLEVLSTIAADEGDITALTTAVAGKQAAHANLTALSALAGAANKMSYFTGAGAMALADVTVFGRSLMDDPDATAGRATLGLGSAAVHAHADYDPAGAATAAQAASQPVDATLTALAALVTAANKMVYATGVDTFAQTDLSPFARTLLDDLTAPAMRTTLGLGTAAVLDSGTAVGNVSLAPEAWHLVGSGGGEPAFQNGWLNYTAVANSQVLRFRRWGNLVRIEGAIKSGATGTVVFTLPAGYRPLMDILYQPCITNAGLGFAYVATTGTVAVFQSTGNITTLCSLTLNIWID